MTRHLTNHACLWVYVLRSKSGRFYYGSTTDLIRRLEQHATGHTVMTSKDGPWTLVAKCAFKNLEAARTQERTFKLWENPQRVLAWFRRSGIHL